MKKCVVFLLAAALIPAATKAQQSKPLDPANMDPAVAPCSNFYQYSNGTWLSNNPVPQAYSSWGSFNILQDKNNETLRLLLAHNFS